METNNKERRKKQKNLVSRLSHRKVFQPPLPPADVTCFTGHPLVEPELLELCRARRYADTS